VPLNVGTHAETGLSGENAWYDLSRKIKLVFHLATTSVLVISNVV